MTYFGWGVRPGMPYNMSADTVKRVEKAVDNFTEQLHPRMAACIGGRCKQKRPRIVKPNASREGRVA
jgi:hypothetical protein